MNKNITCIVLSGGKSSRMGENKALLKIEDKTIIEHTVELMKSIFTTVLLITNTPGEYEFLNIPIHEDIFKEKGPLAGIHSGLVNSSTETNFIISCDLPLMSKEVIEYILNFKTEKSITLCKADDYIQQLAGVYSKSLFPIIESILTTEKKHSVYSLLDKTDSEIIEIEELGFYKKDMFLNMNRPEDYKKILTIINQHPK